MEKKNSKRRQILIIFLVLVLLLGACSAAVTFYVKNYMSEGTVETAAEPLPSLTEAPDKNGFNAYLADTLIAKTYDSKKVKTNLSSSVSIDKDSVSFDGESANADVLKYIVSSLSGRIAENYPSHEGEFGDKFDLFPAVYLNADDITEFEIKQGEVNPDDEETANETEYYYFTAKTNELVTAEDLKPAILKIADSLAEMLDVKNCEIKANGSTVECKTDRLNDEIQSLNLSTDYTAALDVAFKGEYSALGSGKITFNLTTQQNYSYTWAGADITENEIHLKLNEEDALPLEVSLSDKATKDDYKISFESENENAVSVDKDGNIKGLALSKEPTRVTVKFEYLGNTYTDSCLVYVTIPVERIKAQPDKITLKVGETKKLTCGVFPEGATIQDVEWFTEDEKTAVVSADGTVTAVKAGTVKVYAVSKDGSFRSSCTVKAEEVK